MKRPYLKKDKNGFFTCHWCKELFKPNPKAVLDFEIPDVEGVWAVFCSNDCADNFMEADNRSLEEMQAYEPRTDEYGNVLI